MTKKKWIILVCIVGAVVLVFGATIIISIMMHYGNDLPYEEKINIKKKYSPYNIDENTSAKVEYSNGDAGISLMIPDDWEYEIKEPVEGYPEEFGIVFWPEGQTEGKLSLMYYSAWGVCGTGLEEIKIILGEYSAYQGTYNNKDVWDFICLTDTKGRFVALNEGADIWWEEYGTEAMCILSTLQISEDVTIKYPED